MMEGLLYYKEKTDTWTLKTDEKVLCVNSLIYGLADLGFEFDGDGEKVRFSFDVIEI
jgi:hypothetical protein